MEPILDERSLVPCAVRSAGERIRQLAEVLQAMDHLGLRRSLRTVRGAADRDVGDGRGLRSWCFAPEHRDAGRLVALRLEKQPFLDGADGLFASREGHGAIEVSVDAQRVYGVGFAALTDAPAVAVSSAALAAGGSVQAKVVEFDADGGIAEHVASARLFVTPGEVVVAKDWLTERLLAGISGGGDLLARANELLPFLRFGPEANAAIAELPAGSAKFRQIVHHLRVLDATARAWKPGSAFDPVGVRWSPETVATLNHQTKGAMLDFPVPAGFVRERFSYHTKQGDGTRIYFRAVEQPQGIVVLIGYCGIHLDK